MSSPSNLRPWPMIPTVWPLRFKGFGFDARCYNTLHCRVIYDNFNHTASDENVPSGQPYADDWKDHWDGHYIILPSREFPPPAQVSWTLLDGTAHEAMVDIGDIFKDRLILHNVPREDIPDELAFAISPDILMEVNDRTINVYMRAHVTTKQEQIPGNRFSRHRNDLILAWTHTY